jgi:hypothetical protein
VVVVQELPLPPPKAEPAPVKPPEPAPVKAAEPAPVKVAEQVKTPEPEKAPPVPPPVKAPVRAPRGVGTLLVNARPWAEVIVDGKNLGEAMGGTKSFAVPAGVHHVVLKHNQKFDQRDVEIPVNESVIYEYTFPAAPAAQ